MTKFKFEIQNCIETIIEAENAEEARMLIINNLDEFADEMISGSCYVSEGKEVK